MKAVIKVQSKLACILLALIMCLTGCQSTTITQQTNNFINEENKENYKNTLLNFIKTGEIPQEESIFSQNFIESIDDIRKIENAEIKQCYFSNNAIYIQINDMYMFRFQFNTEEKIDSYIVYKIEA